MEVETQKPPPGETWSRWEGQSVNGAFPLRRCLGSSDHSGVFLTEFAERNLPNVALKLVPAIPTLAESQLSHWGEASQLEHPHLIRILETGRCQLGGSHYLYVVMDYAEQNLAQLLLHRALSEAEVREMLPLTLEALAFLHTRNLVQGQLKPSNVLVVENRLALASDTIHPADEATASIGMLSIHNPPEARDGSFSTAGDVWALGVTLCQALTQRTPLQSSERRDLAVLPPDVPPAFNEVLRRCLARNPAQRPSIGELQGWLRTGALAPARTAATEGPERESMAAAINAGADASDLAPGGTSGSTVAPPGPAGSATGSTIAPPRPARPASESYGTLPGANGAAPGSIGTARDSTGAARGSTGTERDSTGAAPGSTGTARGSATAAAGPGKNQGQDAPTRLVIRAVLDSTPPAPEPAERRYFVPVLLGAVVVVAVGWAVVTFFRGASHTNTAAQNQVPAVVSQAQNAPAETPRTTPPVTSSATASMPSSPEGSGNSTAARGRGSPPPATASVPADAAKPGSAAVAPTGDSSAGYSASRRGNSVADRSVTHQDIPLVPAHARATIHGHIKVTVRVTIDATGAVVGESLVRPGPSRYFARLASESARRWRFQPAAGSGSHHEVIRYDFARSGTTAHLVTAD